MKKQLLFYIFLSSIMLAAQENDKSYVWPLSIANGISSTFQEFRSNHFHAGIDLRTFQKTGFPVLAVADGTIEKIIVSWRGIGLAVYLTHRDGNTSLYGHLEKFCARIESLVALERRRSGKKYFGQYTLPAPLAVRQGEIIAFSGESGFGFPHLHLEIRDKLAGAVNPLSLIGNQPDDNHAPRLKGFVLRSCGDFPVNGDLGEFYFKLRKKGPLYAPAAPIEVSGPFDLALHAYDLAGSRHKVAPYSLQAYLDGQLYYQVTFERLLRDDSNQLGMLYDMANSPNSAYFFKLFHQSGFDLEKQKSSFAENFNRLPAGAHEIMVVVKDRQQNQAVAVIPLQKLSGAEPIFPDKAARLEENGRPVLFASDFSTYINRDDVVIKIKDFPRPAAWIKLKIIQGGQEQLVEAKEYGGGVYFCFKPLNQDMHVQLIFSLSDGRQAVEELHKNVMLLVLKSQTARQFSFGDFSADFAAKTVLEPTVLLLENEPLSTDYPLLAGPVTITPFHFTFLDTVFFKFKIPRGEERPEQLGIFKYQPLGNNWRYMQTQNVPEAGYLGCRVLNGGTFALLRDVYPPQIHFRGRHVLHAANYKKLVVRLRDRGKGIDDRTVEVFVNGQKVESEFDPDWGHLLIDVSAGVQKGKNELLVQAADFAGNRSEKTFHFHFK